MCCVLSFQRMTFSEFAAKHARDSRFKAIEKMKDREAIYVEFMTALRKKEKEDSKNRAEKVSISKRSQEIPEKNAYITNQSACCSYICFLV